MSDRLSRFINNPLLALSFILRKYPKLIKNDELYIRIDYFLRMKKLLHLNPPITYNEKLQWLKLNWNNSSYTQLVDKFEVKKHVASFLGEEYIIPTLGVWESFDDIDFTKLPNQFVLKCTHDSGGVVICKDKNTFNYRKARKLLTNNLNQNFYYIGREYPYKEVKPQIIAEKFMLDESGVELKDYKFFCFNGEVKFLFIASERFIDTKFDFYDAEFNHYPFLQGHPNSKKEIMKPKNFDEMKSIASRLSKGMLHVRIDLYDIAGKIYFGEYTFFHFGGYVPFEPDCWDAKVGEWLDLSKLI